MIKVKAKPGQTPVKHRSKSGQTLATAWEVVVDSVPPAACDASMPHCAVPLTAHCILNRTLRNRVPPTVLQPNRTAQKGCAPRPRTRPTPVPCAPAVSARGPYHARGRTAAVQCRQYRQYRNGSTRALVPQLCIAEQYNNGTTSAHTHTPTPASILNHVQNPTFAAHNPLDTHRRRRNHA